MKTHPEKHILWRSLGGKTRNTEPQLGAIKYEAGDRFILNSDGINDGIWNRRLEELIRTPPARFEDLTLSERLVKDSLEESGRDNLTAVVVSIT